MKDIPQLNEHNKEEYPPMHTTEHILNQTMIRLFGCGRAVSAHIERKKSKLDFRFQREPEESEINQIEQQVNRIIQSGLPITTEYITQEEALGRFDLRSNCPIMLRKRFGLLKWEITMNVFALVVMLRIHLK